MVFVFQMQRLNIVPNNPDHSDYVTAPLGGGRKSPYFV